jgi:hypothetical protein
MSTARPSKLAPLLENLFARPSMAWTMLPSGAEIKCKGIEGEREILVRRVGSRPGDVELKTFAKHAGFDDWHVFWLANQVAWLIEVIPDGLFDADLWLEASGKAHLVVRDLKEQPAGTQPSLVKSFVQRALAKTVQPDPEDVADYLESVQAAEEIEPTPAQLDAVLEPTIAQESPEPAPAFAMPESFVLERQRLTDGLMQHSLHLNDEQRKLRLKHLNGLNLEKLRIEFAEYASGSAARALGLKKLPGWNQLPGGSA